MLETALIMLSGTLLGVLSGLLPGVGAVVTLLISYPFIQGFDLIQMLVFYLAIVSASQYSGSVVATTMGIPGDQSSLPAVLEGHALFKQGRGSYAISSAALGSTVGSLIAVVIVLLLMPSAILLITTFYNNNIQLAVLTLSSLLIVFAYPQRWQNLCLFVLGALLSSIGISLVPLTLMWADYIPYESFPSLYQGLPLFPVIVALFVIPTLAKSLDTNAVYRTVHGLTTSTTLTDHILEYFKTIKSSIRGSIIGSISGLVPHLTTVLASNIGYIIEKKIGLSTKTYSHNGDMKSLVAAETANNSAGFVQLIPLLLIGVPITTSEALVLSILEHNSFLINYSTTISSGLFDQLILWFVAINIVAFMLAWPLAKYLHYLYNVPYRYILYTILGVLIGMIWYMGVRSHNEIYYLLTFAVLAPAGYLLRNTNTIIIILAFVLQDKLLAAAVRASVIWTS
jgi:putative tricarboxylic transport membrane protein